MIFDKVKMFIWYWRVTKSIDAMIWITILAIIRIPRKHAPGKLLSSMMPKVCRKEIIMKTSYGTFYGNLAMTANISPMYEQNIHQLIIENYYRNKDRKRIFINIGAHVGKYFIDITKNYGYESYGFEPTPTTYRYLKINTILSDIEEKTHVFNFGLGDKDELLGFYQSTVSGFNTFCPDQRILDTEKIQVPVRRFDDLKLDIDPKDVALVLIDAEGFEYRILRGMQIFLNGLKDVDIIVEIHESCPNKEKILEMMKGLGYTASPIDTANWLFKKEQDQNHVIL